MDNSRIPRARVRGIFTVRRLRGRWTRQMTSLSALRAEHENGFAVNTKTLEIVVFSFHGRDYTKRHVFFVSLRDVPKELSWSRVSAREAPRTQNIFMRHQKVLRCGFIFPDDAASYLTRGKGTGGFCCRSPLRSVLA